MKNIIKSALLLIMSLSLMTACSDDNDSNPTLNKPTEFKLNTPALADAAIDLANSSKIILTCSQPNYGFPASTVYTVQVATKEDMSDLKELEQTSVSAKIEVDAQTLASTLTNTYLEQGKTDADFPIDSKVYFRVRAYVADAAGNKVADSEILSNVVSLNNVHLLYSLPPVNLPTKIYMNGNFCGWNWDKCLEMVPVYDHPETFWHLVYIDDSGFKFNTNKDWDGGEKGFSGINIGGDCAGDIIDNGGNIASNKPGWYLVIVTTSVSGRNIVFDVKFNKPEVFLLGAAAPEGWEENVESAMFTVPTTADGDFVSPAFVADIPEGDDSGLRAYVKIPDNDWWHSEFMVFDKKIVYRGEGGDQARVSCSKGQKLYLNFSNETGEIK